jgi:hypothetical protein
VGEGGGGKWGKPSKNGALSLLDGWLARREAGRKVGKVHPPPTPVMVVISSPRAKKGDGASKSRCRVGEAVNDVSVDGLYCRACRALARGNEG